MSAQNKNHLNTSPVEPEAVPQELGGQVDGPSDFEAEQLLLLDLQTGQQQALEKSGVAAKARDLLAARNGEVMEAREGMLRHAMGPDADIDEAGPVPPELRADLDGENTRLSIALLRTSNRGETIVEQPSVLFTTTELGEDGRYHDVRQIVPIAEGFSDGNVPAESFRPLADFDEEDVQMVLEELAKVRDAQEEGLLPHVGPALNSIQSPPDLSGAMMTAPQHA